MVRRAGNRDEKFENVAAKSFRVSPARAALAFPAVQNPPPKPLLDPTKIMQIPQAFCNRPPNFIEIIKNSKFYLLDRPAFRIAFPENAHFFVERGPGIMIYRCSGEIVIFDSFGR